MKKGLVIILLILFSYSSHAQCWQTLNYCSGIKIDGSLWSWGRNEVGRVGNGTNTFVSQPVRVGTDTWKSVSGIQTVVGVKSNGTLWAWGKNDMGIMLGNTTTSNSNIPIQIGSANDWKIAVADTGGNFLCMAIKLDGTLWAWGRNRYGNLGDGTTIDRNMPVQVGTANNWKSISLELRALALKTDGTIWQWGHCLDDIIRTSPQQVGTDNNWASAKMSAYTAHGLKNDGTLWVWGSLVGEYGLGDGNYNNYRILPGQVGTDNDWVVAGIRTGIKSNGTLWAWGENMYGFHGTGSSISLPYPTQVGTDNDWIDTYESNEQYGTRLKSNGNIWTAGIDDHNFTDTPYVGIEQYLMHIVPTTACPSVLPIIANDDAGNVYSGLGGTAVANVLSNDTYNNVPATTSNVLLTEISLPNRGITLNTATGEIVVSSTMRVGIYTIIYQICAANSALNCDTATVTITVKPQTIEAVNDDFSTTPVDYLNPQITASVLSNDLLNNALISYPQVNITLTNDGGATGAWILPSGEIGVPAGTNRGTYIMEYRICDLNNSLRCDIATVIIKVAERTIETPVLEFAIRANSTVYQSEIQSTGKIITIGAFTKYNNIPAVRIARLNTNLTLDTSFLSTGPFPETEGIGRIAIQPDNKILLIGTFDSFNGSQSGKRIARLNADGTPDLTFNTGGTGFGQNDTPRSIALQNDGKILIGGGWIRTYNGVTVENMIRLNSDGTLDTTFNFPYTYQADARSSIFTILVQPDGKIIVGGNLGHTTYSRTPPNYIPILITQASQIYLG